MHSGGQRDTAPLSLLDQALIGPVLVTDWLFQIHPSRDNSRSQAEGGNQSINLVSLGTLAICFAALNVA